MDINFKKGVYKLNEKSNFDFQLNRVVMWDGGDLEEIKAVDSCLLAYQSDGNGQIL